MEWVNVVQNSCSKEPACGWISECRGKVYLYFALAYSPMQAVSRLFFVFTTRNLTR